MIKGGGANRVGRPQEGRRGCERGCKKGKGKSKKVRGKGWRVCGGSFGDGGAIVFVGVANLPPHYS